MNGGVSTPKIFQATYDYGPKEEQIYKNNPVKNFFKNLAVGLVRFGVYKEASSLSDHRVSTRNRAKGQLQAMGGEALTLQTPDGDRLDAMYLSSQDFKKSLEKYFNVEEITKDGVTQQFLVLKDEFATERETKNHTKGMIPDKEAFQLIKLVSKINEFKDIKQLMKRVGNSDIKRICIPLPPITEEVPPLSTESSSQPTVLIAGGSGVSIFAYKRFAAAYLLRGVNVMLVDVRGYGESEGSPTSHKTKLDLETAYQYLSKEKNVSNQHLPL